MRKIFEKKKIKYQKKKKNQKKKKKKNRMEDNKDALSTVKRVVQNAGKRAYQSGTSGALVFIFLNISQIK